MSFNVDVGVAREAPFDVSNGVFRGMIFKAVIGYSRWKKTSSLASPE